MRQRAGVFAAVFVVVGLVSGLGVGVLGVLARAATAGIQASLAQRVGEDRALRLTVDADVDPQAADEAVRPIIVDRFRTESRAIPIEVHHAVWTATAALFVRLDPAPVSAEPERIVAATIPGLDTRAHLVDGAWPSSDDEATLQADAAATLGLAVGDRVRFADTAFTISGTWRVNDPFAPEWVGDSAMAAGEQLGDAGPLVVPERVWSALAENRRDSWTIVPQASRLDARDLDGILSAWDGLKPAVQLAGIGDVTGEDGLFAVVASQLIVPVRALDAAAPASLLLVGAIALVTLVELGRLLAELRARESALLWARGATPTGIGAATAAETAIVAVLAATIGGGGALLLARVDDSDATQHLGLAAGVLPALTAVAAIAAVAAQSLLATRRATRVDDPARTGRSQRVAGAGIVVLVAIAAVISVSQLLLYGSPVTSDAGGGTSVDVVAVSAPALLILAIVLVGLVVFPWIAPLAERAVARRGSARAVLTARSVARRIALGATPIALVSLAVAQLIIAGGYSATWQRAFDQNQAIRAGAELRVEVVEPGLGDAALDALMEVPGVDRLIPVQRDEVKLGDDYVSLVGVDAGGLADLGLTGGGTVDIAGLARAIREDPVGPELPAGAQTLSLQLAIPSGAPAPRVGAWLSDADGLLRFAPAALSTDAYGYTAPVPQGPGADHRWRLVAIDVTPVLDAPDPQAPPVTILLHAASADGVTIDLGTGWTGVGFSPDASPLAGADPNGMQLDAEMPFGRLIAPSAGLAHVVISGPVADRMGAVRGSSLVLPFDGAPLHVGVSAVTGAVPAAARSSALLIDSQALATARLHGLVEVPAPTLYWIGTDDPTATAAAIRAAFPELRVIETSRDPDRPMLGAAALAVWLGAAGSVLLVLAALSALLGAQLGARGQEAAVLRALGVTARQQGGIRRGELALLASYGAVIGIVAGFTVVALTVAFFARAAIPDAYSGLQTRVAFDAGPLAAVLLGTALAIAALIGGYGARVSRQARRAIVQEEAR